MLLWVILAIITAAVIYALIVPLSAVEPDAPDASDIELYKSQLQEIDADVERGVLAPEEARSARVEISRRLLRVAAESDSRAKRTAPALTRHAAVAIGVATTALSLGLYLSIGSPSLPGQPLSARLDGPIDSRDIPGMVARVERRLRAAPEDGAGWNVIAPVYMRLQRFDDAAEAYAKAMRYLGETPERLAGYAEAATFANNGSPTPQAREAFAKALSQKPDLLNARFWLAVAEEDDGNYDAARAAYQRMLDSPLPEDWRRLVTAKLALTEARLSGEPPSGEGGEQAMVEGMVARLAERLAREGGPLGEWLRLARAYAVLGRSEEAAATIGKAKEKFGADAEAAREIDALALSLGLRS